MHPGGFVIPELAWLPKPQDWSRLISDAEAGAALSWREIQALAGFRLDFLQTDRLARFLASRRPSPPSDLSEPPVRLVVLGSSTTSHLTGAIRVAGLRRGIWIETWEPPYGQYRQALADETMRRFAANAALIALDARHIAAGLPLGASRQDAERACEQTLADLAAYWVAVQETIGGIVLQQTILPVLPSVAGENEHVVSGSHAAFVSRINAALPEMAERHGVHLVSVHKHIASGGLEAWHDPAIWFRAKQEVSPNAAPFYGDLVARVLAAAKGRGSKALVLDLDNTLWGGVVGDDGVEGIELGQGSGDGEAFAAVQMYALELAARGVILAVCSKNDDAVARSVFANHPEMAIKLSDIAAFVANWDDKATNIARIAKTLNLGLDAIVLLDDNPFERNLVRQALPEVAVPELPDDDPSLTPQLLADAGYFEAVTITAEDVGRAAQYRANLQRASALAEAGDVEGYLAGLRMRLEWRPFDEAGLARIVQLVNKTNQFNLTGRRADMEGFRRLMGEHDSAGLQFRLADRLGDNGMIAVVVLRRSGDAGVIDTWLMSCRVLGRGVEDSVLGVVVEVARELGCQRLVGEYRPTERNAMVAGLYPRLGFRPLDQRGPCDGPAAFELLLADWRPAGGPIQVEQSLAA